MSLSYGLRPRSHAERLKMTHALAYAPAVVEVEGDDGWATACLMVAGRQVVAGAGCDVPRIERALRKFGLPRLGKGLPAAVLKADLTLVGEAEAGRVTADRVEGPLVSLLICTFNRASMVGAAIASAKAQSWPCEIVVVDDGSTDGTADVLAGIPGIRVFHQPNGGKPRALARAIAEAKGEALLVLDDDDLLLPGAVRVLAHALFGHPELTAVWADTVLFDGATGAPHGWYTATTVPGSMAFSHTLMRVPAMPGATLVRRSAQEAAGGYDPTLIRGQDIDMFQRLARIGPIEGIPLPAQLYRVHDGLRGAADGQWRLSDLKTHQERFLSFVAPRFKAFWEASSPVADRAESHAWALGLAHRGMAEEARAEAQRWPAPFTPAERFVRDHLGLLGPLAQPVERLVVVDDGDHGALEETLVRHLGDHALFVDLEVPRDPLDAIRLHWQGEYAARERIHRWVRGDAPVHLRLSSAPEWAPPPLRGTEDVPDLPAPDALLALAAAFDWELPTRTRPGLVRIAHPVARAMVQARLALRKGQAKYAIHPLSQVLKLAPEWRLGWELSAHVFEALGYTNEAASCRRQAISCRSSRAA